MCKIPFALMVLFLSGCATAPERATEPRPAATAVPHATDAGPHPWTHLHFKNDPADFQFVIMGDRTGRHRPGVFESGVAKTNLLRPEFVMCVGDLIEGYTQDGAEIDEQWDEIAGFVSKLESPFFYLPGNHDISNSVQAKKWQQRFGRAYYHFVYQNCLFLCLNTSDPAQVLSKEQLDYVERALKENANVRWTCLFLHEPLWDYKKPTGWDKVEAMLKGRAHTVFAGHYHTYTKYVRNDKRYFVLATTGGGMKEGLVSPELGSFDHVTWVTMTDRGPRLANLALDGIHDEDVRTEEMANLINRVLRGDVLRIAPVLTSATSFARGATTLTFVNDADVPMKVTGTIPAAGVLSAVPDAFEVTVSAHGKADVPVELRASQQTPVAELPRTSAKWSATYLPPGRKPVRVPREDVLAVEGTQPCPARTSPVTIDGKLGEWEGLPIAADRFPAAVELGWGGPKDSSYRFAVQHDDAGNVYVAVETTDDKAVLNAGKMPWSQDGIEVRLDARAEPERSLGRGRAEFKDILVVSMSPAEPPGKMVLYSAEELPPGVKAVCVKTSTGHAAEIVIPAGYLDGKQGTPWTAFRLNVCVNDFDDAKGPLKALWWRPDWRSAGTLSGSGTFERR